MDQSIVVNPEGGGGPMDGLPFQDDVSAVGYKAPQFENPGDGS